jgi:hypothetical protein
MCLLTVLAGPKARLFLSLILSSMSNTFLNSMLMFAYESQAGAVCTLWGSHARTWLRSHLCFFSGVLAST